MSAEWNVPEKVEQHNRAAMFCVHIYATHNPEIDKLTHTTGKKKKKWNDCATLMMLWNASRLFGLFTHKMVRAVLGADKVS